MIYGVVGKYSSGKDTVADYLVEHGYPKFSFSEEIVEEHQRRYGIPPPDREAFIQLADEWRETEGEDVMARKILKKIEDKNLRDAVIVSIRTPAELARLKTCERFKLVVIDAPVSLRYSRGLERKSMKDRVSFEEFKAQEHRESNAIGTKMNLNLIMEKPDVFLFNDGSIEDLHKELDELV
ncbi:MAG: hypothetical protein ACE5FT_05685 [Candidatus Nanoarchaeia archaeon]